MRRWRLCTNDDGNASLEFITTGMILLLPLVYLVLVMAAVQGGVLAVEGAARQAVRVFVQASTAQEAQSRAQRAIQFGLKDYGLDAQDATVTVSCSPTPSHCLHRLGEVTITVAVSVHLPLVPSAISTHIPLSVPLTATATERVSRFWSAQ